MRIGRLLAAAATVFLTASCISDTSIRSGQTSRAGATNITDSDDLDEFDLSHTESLDVDADGWRVTSATRGYVTGDGLAANAKSTEVRITATVGESDDYPSVLCFADERMLGGYDVRFGNGTVTLIDSQVDGGLVELETADVDLTSGLSVTVTCEYFDDDSIYVTVAGADGTTVLGFRDESPDRREGRVAVRVSGGSTVTVFQTLHFSTTAA